MPSKTHLNSCSSILALWLAHSVALAQPAAPASITTSPATTSNQVAISWPPVEGAVSYNIKRGSSPSAVLTTLGNTTSTFYQDSTASPGVTYYYTVTAIHASGESPPTRGLMAATSTIVDNGGSGTSFTGSWTESTLTGFFGTPALFASPTSATSPTATYTFTPNLPTRGNYDVYLRWTAHTNRASNTPVDLVFPDGTRTLTVNQQLNNGTWILLTNITAEAGASTSLTIRNNGANGNVIADAVQFIPRIAPWAPSADLPFEYSLLPFEDHFDGSALETSRWATFMGRSEYTISDGRLRTRLRYRGTTPIASATTAELTDESNWIEGGIIALQAQKFGFHEARIRLPLLPARGVDTAYWHAATDELINGYEIDAPEFFHKDSSGVANNYGFGVWDHIDGQRTWDFTRNNSTLGNATQYVTVGLEWRTDNTQVVYLNGSKVYTAPTSGMNDTESILPSNIILSTKVLDWLRPNAALDGAETLWDYARYYQKPGFLGSVSNAWDTPANWGPDGIPSPGFAAIFNMPDSPANIAVNSDQELQSLFLDGPSLPAHTFSGTGTLKLGTGKPGDSSATHGGILVNTSVTNHQTFNTPIFAAQNLQFANLSRNPGTTLFLNGEISANPSSPRDVDFVSSLSANANHGFITLTRPLGLGIRHINRAGDSILILPANSLHTGELRIGRGPVAIPSISSLGTTPNSAVIFRPRYKHSDSWRPRLRYTGPGETSAHPIRLGGWQADGILESNGNGPLSWSGNVEVAPFAEIAKQALTRDASLTLSATASSGENQFSGTISDAGATVTYLNSDNSANSGPATLRINKTGAGTWALTGNNSYSGTTSINGGTLVVSSINSTNSGSPALPASSLGTPTTPESGTIAITSGTLRYTGPGETTNRIIHLAGSSGATLDQSGTGLLRFTSNLISNASSKTLTLTGSGQGEIAGSIPDNGTTTRTSLTKSGTGTWRLSGTNTYTGTTSVTAGTLIVDGTIASGGNLTVSNSGTRLTGSGTINTPSIINASISASPLTFTNSLTLGSTARVQVDFSGNHSASVGTLSAGALSITNGARVDLSLNAPGSTTNFLASYWRSPRSLPIITHNSRSGNLALGTITPDSAGNNHSTYGSFSLQQTSTSINLIWTPIPGFPVIDEPTLTLASPLSNPVALENLESALNLSANVGGGASILWSQISGPGTITFSSASSAETTAIFSAPGSYVLRATASNALGSAQREFTLVAAPPTTLTFRQGINTYSHDTTFIRGDSPSWNSGARNEFLVGRNNGGLRGLMAFDISSVPPMATIESASLNLWATSAGTGSSLNSLDLHELLTQFTEGTGDGSSATNGIGSGADWTNRSPSTPWITAGAAETSEFNPTPLASITNLIPSSLTSGFSFSFPSNPAITDAARRAFNQSTPLDFMLKMALDTSGANRFVRIASDDHANAALRPLLTLTLGYNFLPTVNPGPPPASTTSAPSPLTGSTTNATQSLWSLVQGPGTVVFSDPSSVSTTATFSTPGSYQLRLTASNPNGNASRTINVQVMGELQAWRMTHFNSQENSGNAANLADPDGDGIPNLIEFATGSSPTTRNPAPTALATTHPNLELTYRRSHSAVAQGITFEVEWSRNLAADWSTSGVTHTPIPDTDNGSSTLWKATLPSGADRRFVRLKTTSPNP